MPKLTLTNDQAAMVQKILDQQTICRVGYIAVCNFGFDRQTGHRIVDLSFVALKWQDAVSLCKRARKLAAEAESSEAAIEVSEICT